MSRLPLLAMLLLLAGPASAAPLSLEEAVREALSGNLGLLRARYEVLLARDRQALAWGAFEPRLEAGFAANRDLFNFADPESPLSATTGSIGVSQALPGGGTASLDYASTKYDADAEALGYSSEPDLTFSLRQPLLSGALFGSREQGVDQATWGLGSAELDLHTALADLVLELEEAYWSLVQTDQGVQAARSALAGAEHQQAWMGERIGLGFDPPSEALATQERVASAQAALQAARAARADAEARLRYLLGRDLTLQDGAIEPTTAPTSYEPSPPEEAVAAAERANLELRLARRQLARARRDLRFTVVEQLPSLDGNFNLRKDFGRVGPLPWTVGLSLSLPLPGRARVHGILAAKRQMRQVEIAVRDAEQRVRLQVESVLRELETTAARLTLADTILDVAQRKHDAEVERLSRGRSTNKTVLDYLEDRDAARRGRDDTIVDLARAAGRLRRLCGTNLEFWALDLRALLDRKEELK